MIHSQFFSLICHDESIKHKEPSNCLHLHLQVYPHRTWKLLQHTGKAHSSDHTMHGGRKGHQTRGWEHQRWALPWAWYLLMIANSLIPSAHVQSLARGLALKVIPSLVNQCLMHLVRCEWWASTCLGCCMAETNPAVQIVTHCKALMVDNKFQLQF